MELIPIEVQCYAGHKADETPRRFRYEGGWIEVVAVQDRWYQSDRDSEWPIADYFKILGSDGHRYLLKRDREADAWYLVAG